MAESDPVGELKACVVGAGEMGSHHINALSAMEGVALAGVSDGDEDRLRRAGRGRSFICYDDVARMLDELRPDFVIVSVPTDQHEAVALQCLEGGAHALVEKPVAENIESALRMQARAVDKGLLLTVGHIERFNPAVIALRQKLSEGVVGKVFQVVARRTGPFPPRVRDVGAIKDLATHDLDVIRFVFDSPFEFVFAQLARHLHSTHEDLASIVGRLENGAIASLDVNWLTPTKIRELRVVGEGGMYLVNYLRQDLTLYRNGELEPGFDAIATFAGVSEGEVVRHPIPRKEPLVAELEAFSQAILSGGPAPVPVSEAIEALRLAEAILGSAERNEPVRLG